MKNLFRDLSTTIKVILVIQLAAILLCTGMFIGSQIERARTSKLSLDDDAYGTTIAIVNLDEGYMENDQLVYYSNNFLQQLGPQYALVSLQIAQQGLENGTYGGIVTIPTSMSKDIASINSENPTPVVLRYVLNENQPEAKYIKSYTEVHNLQKKLSNSSSYLNIASILNHLHLAQNNIREIFENDQYDLEMVNHIRSTNFMPGFTLSALPDAFDVSSLETFSLTPTSNLVDGLVIDVSAIYDECIAGFINGVNDFETLVVTMNADLEAVVNNNELLILAFNGYKDELEAFHNNWVIYKSEYNTFSYDYYNSQYDAIIEDCKNYFISKYESSGNSWTDDFGTVTFSYSPITMVDINDYTSSHSIPSMNLQTFEEYIVGRGIDNTVYNTFKTNLTTFSSLVSTFHPIGAFDDKIYVTGGPLDVFNNAVANQMNEYSRIVTDNHILLTDYSNLCINFAYDVSDKANTQYQSDSETLSKALDEFYKSKRTTSISNENLLGRLEYLLPNSRKGNLINQQFVDTTVSPIDIQGNAYRTTDNSVKQQNLRYKNTLLMILLGLLLLLVATLIGTRLINRKKELPRYM